MNNNDIQPTVNLKDRMAKERQRLLRTRQEQSQTSKASGIDEVYQQENSANSESNLKRISRPVVNKNQSDWYKKIIMAILAIALIVGGFYYFSHRQKSAQPQDNTTNNWYAVKLQNGEVYYGEIDNTSGDPVVLKNVYYDYDQVNKTAASSSTAVDASHLRLVKKGKETYGPAGVMELVRSNIIYMDLLKSDSKVLQAILNYENKNKN